MLIALTALIPLAAPLAAPSDGVTTLHFVPQGATQELGGYRPQRAALSADRPATITKLPDDLAAPVYAVLPIGEGPGIALVLDEPEGGTARLFVDANRNGDLADDPACEWAARESKSESGATLVMHQGSVMVDLGAAGKPLQGALGCYRFDPHDPQREALKDSLLYYRDYAAAGSLDLGGRSCKAMLDDEQTSGDFRGKADTGEAGSGVALLLDANGNGAFDVQGERFDVRKPFNIGGTTWELADLARDGTSLRVVKSEATVAEIPTPPDHSVGKVITPLQGTDTAGKPVNFPADYAGKIVLLDFWATWCGPCMKEMPNVVSAYGKLHAQGFEIQGVSLDNEKTLARMPEVMGQAGMTWRQVADGKGWKAAIGELYAIRSIPATFLVDGTTGTILGTNLRGEALADAVEKPLAARKTTP